MPDYVPQIYLTMGILTEAITLEVTDCGAECVKYSP
jgi:hypothetical protein